MAALKPIQPAMASPRCRWMLALALLWVQPAWLALPRRLAVRLAGITALWGGTCYAQEFGAPGRKVPLGDL